MSEPGCPAQDSSPGLQTDDQSPPVQPPLNQSEPIYEVGLEDHDEHIYMCPDLGPPPAGLQPESPPLPVQPVMNPPGPSNPVPHQVQSYTGCPAQDSSPGLQTDDQSPPVQPPLNQSEPIYEVDLEDHDEHIYMCPEPDPPPAVLQPESPPLPVQPVMYPPGPVNTPYIFQPNKDYPVQSYVPCAIPQTAGPGLVPPAMGLEPQNQPLPVQTVMNPVGYPFQNYPPYTIAQTAGPGLVPPATGLEPQNQPLPVQTVMNPPDPSNPTPHLVQSYTGHPLQNNFSNPMPESEVTDLQSENQQPLVQSVLKQPDPSNPVFHQPQPYAAPAVPPPVLLFGVPPGLEYLTQIDQILIHQEIECIKMLSGFETDNQYEIKNSIGQEIYHVKEESDCLVRNLFGPAHGFKMHIKDSMDQEIIQLHRPMRCFLQEIEVQAPPGVIIGYVKQEWSVIPTFTILGPSYEELLKIQGPIFPFLRCGDVEFEVKGIIGEQTIGRITKQQSGLIKQCITDTSNFCIQFPLDLDVKMKAVLLGACLFIDIIFFDKGGHLLLKLIRVS
ncbi:phospholipid scramblase 1 isoform X2 [Carassius auratus]|uniref:Phospholipid scramblase 1 isoform X2 n=1 Tax=Carassius auratus TaxID=7957 RepID=A0A6P6PP13_CARAU|nr:phospholipid scramblase 1-like isoform X2 [Carassius auratus]